MDRDIVVDGVIVLLIAYYNNPQPRTMLFWYMFRHLGQNAYIVFALTLDRSVSALGLEMLLWTTDNNKMVYGAYYLIQRYAEHRHIVYLCEIVMCNGMF